MNSFVDFGSFSLVFPQTQVGVAQVLEIQREHHEDIILGELLLGRVVILPRVGLRLVVGGAQHEPVVRMQHRPIFINLQFLIQMGLILLILGEVDQIPHEDDDVEPDEFVVVALDYAEAPGHGVRHAFDLEVLVQDDDVFFFSVFLEHCHVLELPVQA